MIYKRFYGDVLLIKIDEDKAEKFGEYSKSEGTGIFIPKDKAAKEDGYRLATVIQVSQELLDMYGPGDRIQIPAVAREKRYVMGGETYWRIPKQDVMGVLTEEADKLLGSGG